MKGKAFLWELQVERTIQLLERREIRESFTSSSSISDGPSWMVFQEVKMRKYRGKTSPTKGTS